VNKEMIDETTKDEEHLSPYVSFAEAALILGVSRRAVYQAVASGLLSESEKQMGKKTVLRDDVLKHKIRPNSRRKSQPSVLADQLSELHRQRMEAIACAGCGELVLRGTTKPIAIPILVTSGCDGSMNLVSPPIRPRVCMECLRPERWKEIEIELKQRLKRAYERGRFS
jgi:hypothetical protein